MKILTLSVLLFLSGTLLFAGSVNEDMEAIHNANPQDRVRLLNTFKSNIVVIGNERRNAAISKLRLSMQNANSKPTQINTLQKSNYK